jgi:Rad3-related DNA helicase
VAADVTLLDFLLEDAHRELLAAATDHVLSVTRRSHGWSVASALVTTRNGNLYCTTCRAPLCCHTVAVQLSQGLDRTVEPDEWPRPAALGLPAKFAAWRAIQVAAIKAIIAAYRDGSRFVLLEAPTGSGKSLIAEAVAILLSMRSLYLCTTKQLQDQILTDFPSNALLKGRGNYPTRNHPEIRCDACERREGQSECSHCLAGYDESGSPIHACPYLDAKRRLIAAQHGVVNTALFLSEANYVGELSGVPFVIIDEADELENALMAHIEVRVSKKHIAALETPPPKHKTKMDEWAVWATDAADRAETIASDLADPKLAREYSALAGRLRKMSETIGEGCVWVNCSDEDTHTSGPYVFKPVRVDQLAQQTLWRHGGRFLCMSATFLDPKQFCRDVGITDQATVVRLPSGFPVERRPVYYQPVGSMAHASESTTAPAMIAAVDAILAARPKARVLIHTVSYGRMQTILTSSAHHKRMIGYSMADARTHALDKFRRTPNAVLVAPSMTRGVDLPYDACDCVILVKVPYPYLGDKQINARLYGHSDGRNWYALQAVRTIIQAAGRGMRHADDLCECFILDEDFLRLYRDNRGMFPEWWQAALHMPPAAH